jgi:hypothetical protein
MIPAQITSGRRSIPADRQALDDVGAMPGLGSLGDRADGTIVGASIIFGDPDDQAGDDEAQQHAPIKVHAGEAGRAGGHRRIQVAERILGGEIDRYRRR